MGGARVGLLDMTIVLALASGVNTAGETGPADPTASGPIFSVCLSLFIITKEK